MMHTDESAAGPGTDDVTADPTPAQQLGKRELAVALGWSRPRLDRFITLQPDFPVITRGTQRGGWAFDLAAARAFIERAGGPKTTIPTGGVGKRDLAKLLNRSIDFINRCLSCDPSFPILQRGGRSGGWAFDVATVRRYLATNPPPRKPAANRYTHSVRALQAVLPAEQRESIVSMKGLMAALGWSRYRLRQQLCDPYFPVLCKGKHGGWIFDLRAVRAYLDGADGD